MAPTRRSQQTSTSSSSTGTVVEHDQAGDQSCRPPAASNVTISTSTQTDDHFPPAEEFVLHLPMNTEESKRCGQSILSVFFGQGTLPHQHFLPMQQPQQSASTMQTVQPALPHHFISSPVMQSGPSSVMQSAGTSSMMQSGPSPVMQSAGTSSMMPSGPSPMMPSGPSFMSPNNALALFGFPTPIKRRPGRPRAAEVVARQQQLLSSGMAFTPYVSSNGFNQQNGSQAFMSPQGSSSQHQVQQSFVPQQQQVQQASSSQHQVQQSFVPQQQQVQQASSNQHQVQQNIMPQQHQTSSSQQQGSFPLQGHSFAFQQAGSQGQGFANLQSSQVQPSANPAASLNQGFF